MAQITVTFENYEEMMNFAGQLTGGAPAASKATKPEPVKPEKEAPAADVKQTAQGAPDTDAGTQEAEKTYSLEDVRAALAALNKAGKRDAVHNLIASFGAAKLTDIEESRYPELMKKAGEL